MSRQYRDPLARLSVTTPCPADWDSMSGNDRVRFCSHCALSVNNLSEMTRTEALALVRKSQGRLCVRYYSRPDGSIQIGAPKLHSIKRRASRLAAGAFTATLSLCASAAAQTPAPTGPSAADAVRIVKPYETARLEQQGSPQATLTGTITDPNGAVVPGLTLTLLNTEGNIEQAGVSDNEGSFRFQGVPPGKYSMQIEASAGFAATRIVDIQLAAGEERRVDPMLELASQTATVGLVMISEPRDAVVKAASNNDLAAVKELIAQGVDVNIVDEDVDSTPLMQAVGNGNHEMVRMLLDAGARVDAKNGSGMTALMMTREGTTVDIVWTLISAGAKVNRRDEMGNSPLVAAALQGNTPVLRALIDAGAKVNAKTKEGKTALMWAVEGGFVENIRVLLNAGADVNWKNKDDETALSMARDQEKEEIIKLLEAYGARE